jgi:signal transduction histidine kinase
LMHSDDLASGTLHIERKCVNLWRVVDSTVHQFRTQAAQSGVSLTLGMEVAAREGEEGEEEGGAGVRLERLRVIGDEVKLEQVVGMLVGNAVRSVERGGHVAVTGKP